MSTGAGASVPLAAVSGREVRGSEAARFSESPAELLPVSLCLFKECSKKTKTDDQEDASVDRPSPAQEDGEASGLRFCTSPSERGGVSPVWGPTSRPVVAPRGKVRQGCAKPGQWVAGARLSGERAPEPLFSVRPRRAVGTGKTPAYRAVPFPFPVLFFFLMKSSIR